MSLKARLQDDMKSAMRAKEQPRLDTIRLILSAVKQREVDERITLSDDQILTVLEKMLKQRRDSITQFRQAERHDLADKEEFEAKLIQHYLPTPLTDEELDVLIEQVVNAQQATTIKDLGKVIAAIKPQVQGRADLAQVSQRVKTRLGG